MASAVSGARAYATARAGALLVPFGPGGSVLTPGDRGSWETDHQAFAAGRREVARGGAAGRGS